MNDPYVSFDTFSVGADLDNTSGDAAPARPPLLARLPRVAPAPPRPKTIQRFDEAEAVVHGVHLSEGETDLEPMGPAEALSPRFTPSYDPTATIRIDTVAPNSFDEDESFARPRTQPEPLPATAPSPAITSEEAIDDPWAAWLLNLESAILPYSRIIVLAAVIAALGLTLVLLRGAGVSAVPSNDPSVRPDAPNDVFATIETVTEPTPDASSLYWPAPSEPVAAADLRPIEPAAVASAGKTPPASASGPASAWQRPAVARLSGEVLPVESTRVNVADATNQPNYPRTTR